MNAKTSQKRVLFVYGLRPVLLVFLSMLSMMVSCYFSRSASAATNSTINFQARLMTSGGGIVPDGNYNVEFKLYNALTSSGSSQGSCTGDANCLWTETRTGANVVRVANGYLSVSLGSITAFPTTINWDQGLWLTMNIGGTGTPTWDGEMTPRLQLTAVPYAFRAGQLAQYNGTTGFTSTLNLLQPTGGNQTFNIPDQGAAGTYSLLTTTTANTSFIQLQGSTPGTAQTGNFNITGTGIVGTTLQAPALDRASSGTLTIGGTNATAITVGPITTFNHAIVLNGGAAGTTTFVTPQNSSVPTSINIPIYNPGAFGQIVAFGLPSTAPTSARAISVFDARTSSSDLQPTIALFNPGESDLLGFSWGGSNVVAEVKTEASSISIDTGSTSLAFFNKTGGVGIGTNFVSPTYPLDVVGDINTSTQYRIAGSIICTSAGCSPSSGSSNYIQNQAATPQSANFFIQSAASAITATAQIQQAVGQTGDLLQFRNSSGTLLGKFDSGVNLTIPSLAINQTSTTDATTINLTNTAGTVTNGLLVNRNGTGGTTTNGLNVTNTLGTLTNGLAFSGTIGTDITRASGTLTLQGGSGITLTAGGTAQNINLTPSTTGTVVIGGSAPTITSAGNLTIQAAGTNTLLLDTGGTGIVNIGTSNAGTINIGAQSGFRNSTVNIATDFNNTQTVSIGSDGTAANATTILAGSTGGLNIGTGSGSESINIGSTLGSSTSVNIKAGNGGINIGFVFANQFVNIGSSGAAATTVIQGGSGTGAIQIDASATGTVSIGSLANETLSLGSATTTGTVTIGGTAETGTLTIGRSTSANTIVIGNAALTNAQTISIGTAATGTGTDVITIGSTNGASSTTIQGGTGNVNLVTNAASTGAIVKTNTNSSTAFQVQNTSGTALLNFSTSQGVLTTYGGSLTINGVANPAAPTLTSTSTGGTLAANTYLYRIDALGADGSSTTASIPSSPGSVTTTGSTSKNTLSWTAVSNTTGYDIYRSTDGGSTWFINTVSSATTSIVDNGTTYTWATSGSLSNISNAGGINLQTSTGVFFDAGSGGTYRMEIFDNVNGNNTLTMGNYNTGGTIDIQAQNFYISDTSTYNHDVAMTSTGAVTFKNNTNSNAAFVIQNSGSANLFTADTSNERIIIGPSGGDSVGAVLVLGNKTNSTTDPAGVEGGIYYNGVIKQFRCYHGGNWFDCGSGSADTGFNLYDDFLDGAASGSGGTIGSLGWSLKNLGTPVSNAVAYNSASPAPQPTVDRPGILDLSTGTGGASTGDNVTLRSAVSGSNNSMMIGAGYDIKTAVAVSSIATNATAEILRVGLFDEYSAANTPPATGAWWEVNMSATKVKWQYCYNNTSTPTCADSGVTVAANTMVRLEIHIDSLSQITFTINGTATVVSGITVNQTNTVNPSIICMAQSATTQDCYVDYYQLTGTATALR